MSRTAIEATSTFYQGSPGLRVFRVALAATERLWPALAVRIAQRLFLTPLPPKWVHKSAAWRSAWRMDAWAFEGASVTLYSPPAAPHAPVVLLVHGWGGHAGQMLALAEAVAVRGLRPVLVEMPAHGASAGASSTLPQFARAIEYVSARLVQQGFELQALVAHSLGATASAFAVSRGLPVRRLVLLAPAASPPAYTRLFAQVFGLSEATRAAMQRRIEAREGLLMPQFEPPALGARVQVPTLVVHDRGDSINAFADGEAYARAIPGAQLMATDALGHRRILKEPSVLARAADFLG